MATPEAEAMAAIVGANADLLKRVGFRKRRHSFNRACESGVVHVVNFWQHPKEPPAWTEVPGLRERRYGTFRLDFGVYVPQIRRDGSPKSSWVNEYDCHLRRTIGQLQGAPTDLWWDLDETTGIQLSRDGLDAWGLPWLDRFPDQDAILRAFALEGPFPLGMSPAGGLDIAEMLAGLGREDEARGVLEDYVARPLMVGHAAYVAGYLTAIGHEDLARRISTRLPDES